MGDEVAAGSGGGDGDAGDEDGVVRGHGSGDGDRRGGGVQYGPSSRKAWLPAVKSAAIDTLFFPGGFATENVLREGIFLTSGLEQVDRAGITGVAGKTFGSYAPYLPRHTSDFVGYNMAKQFLAHPTPVLVQIGGRAVMNGVSCNGGDIERYC